MNKLNPTDAPLTHVPDPLGPDAAPAGGVPLPPVPDPDPLRYYLPDYTHV